MNSNYLAQLILWSRYQIIDSGSDEEIIGILDLWLESWLYKKDNCPNCGSLSYE